LTHKDKALLKAIDLQKRRNKRGVRLNLWGQESKGIVDCYSPAQVVKAREYAEQKEADEKRKYERIGLNELRMPL
jgi:hypothetical protein